MSLKKRIYYYTIGKKSKKGLIQILCVIAIFLLIVPTGVSTYENINNKLKVPTYLEIGDLLFCDIDEEFISKAQSFGIEIPFIYTNPGLYDDHVAIYIGDNKFIEASPYHSDSENEKLYGVVISGIGLLKLWSKNIRYGKVNATSEQKENAVEWAINQLGQPYQSDYTNKNCDPKDKKDKYSDEWYCTELVWAAYKSQGIDLDKNTAEKDIVTMADIKGNEYFSFYNEDVKNNSDVNFDLSLLMMCLLDLKEDKQNL